MFRKVKSLIEEGHKKACWQLCLDTSSSSTIASILQFLLLLFSNLVRSPFCFLCFRFKKLVGRNLMGGLGYESCCSRQRDGQNHVPASLHFVFTAPSIVDGLQPSSVLASSNARSYCRSFLLLVVRPGAPRS